MGGRILIAEDDYDLRAIMTYFLNSKGYEAFAVSDGRKALEALSTRPFDLLILDMSMPDVDGWTVLRQLRAQPTTQKLPVMAFTAHVFASDVKKATQAGCNGFIAKPFEPPVLLAEIERLLGHSNGTSSQGSSAA